MDIIKTKLSKSKRVLPIPYKRFALYNYPTGFDKQLVNKAIYPRHENDIIYANELPPAPRSQLKPAFPIKNPKIYNKNKIKNCVKGYSTTQYMPAFVCSSGGNADFVRGNEFSVDYNRDKMYNGLKREIEIVEPEKVDTQYYMNSDFYPYPNFDYTKNNNYKTYPHPKTYSKNGIPFYHNSGLYKR